MKDDEITVNTLLGCGTSFNGEIKVSGTLKLDGDFSGSIESSGSVFVGKDARVESSIKAVDVVIGGTVKGNIEASGRVSVLSTGIMLGDISASRLVVEDGVVLDGICHVSIDKGRSE